MATNDNKNKPDASTQEANGTRADAAEATAQASGTQAKASGTQPAEAGTGADAGTSQRADLVDQALREATATYEKARSELGDALSRMRAEVAKIDLEQAGTRARTWVEENPTLALFVGLGAGMLIGRFLGQALTPPPPPPLSKRAKYKAQALSHQASRYARDLGDRVAEQAALTGKGLAGKAERLADDLSEGAGRFREAAADTLGHTAEDVSRHLRRQYKKAKKKTSHGLDMTESMLNAAKTAVAAVVVKQVNDWMKRLSR